MNNVYIAALLSAAKNVKMEDRSGELNRAIKWAEEYVIGEDPIIKQYIIEEIRKGYSKEKGRTGYWMPKEIDKRGPGWVNVIPAMQMYRRMTGNDLTTCKQYVNDLLAKMERHQILGEDL